MNESKVPSTEAAGSTGASDDRGAPGHFEADVSDDVIRAALESVAKHSPAAGGVEVEVEAAAATPEAGERPSVDELERELKEVKATLELSASRARETLDRLKDVHERHLRAAADLENYKKRALREREESERFGNTKLLKEFLPVLDNLDRALEHASGAAEAPDSALAEGIAATRRLFVDTFSKFGVKAFAAIGTPFDPNRHEAMQQLPTDAQPPGTVARELVRGYLLHDRLLRPALVVVAVPLAPAPAAEPEGATADRPEATAADDGGSTS